MKKYLKQLSSDSFIYGLSGVLIRFGSVFLIPVYTKIFLPEDYAIINMINISFVVLNIFVVMGLDNSVALWYWDKEELQERKRTFASWVWFMYAFALLLILPILIFAPFFSELLFDTDEYHELIRVASLTFVFSGLQNVYSNWLKIQRRALSTVIYASVISFSNILLSIVLVVYYEQGLKGVFYAQLVTAVVSFVFVIFSMNEWLAYKFYNRQRLTEMLKFGLPLIPVSVCYWVLNSAGAYFIQHYNSRHDLGLFQVANSIATGMTLISYAFINAWTPFAMSIAKQDDAKAVYADSLLIYTAVLSFFEIGLFLFAPEILFLVTSEAYQEAYLVVGLLGFNVFFSSVVQIVSLGSALAKSNIPFGKSIIIGTVLTFGLYYIMVPAFGKEGAVFASIFGNIVTVGFVYYYSQRLYFIPYKLYESMMVLSVAILFCMSLLLIGNQLNVVTISLKIALLLLFAGFLYWYLLKLKRISLK